MYVFGAGTYLPTAEMWVGTVHTFAPIRPPTQTLTFKIVTSEGGERTKWISFTTHQSRYPILCTVFRVRPFKGKPLHHSSQIQHCSGSPSRHDIQEEASRGGRYLRVRDVSSGGQQKRGGPPALGLTFHLNFFFLNGSNTMCLKT